MGSGKAVGIIGGALERLKTQVLPELVELHQLCVGGELIDTEESVERAKSIDEAVTGLGDALYELSQWLDTGVERQGQLGRKAVEETQEEHVESKEDFWYELSLVKALPLDISEVQAALDQLGLRVSGEGMWETGDLSVMAEAVKGLPPVVLDAAEVLEMSDLRGEISTMSGEEFLEWVGEN